MIDAVVTSNSWAYTVPGMSLDEAQAVVAVLQQRLDTLNEFALTLKHVHWNVVGPYFIAVHAMIDPQVEAVREMVDAIAERIATLGSSPNGLPGGMVARRDWRDYELGRYDAIGHLRALSVTYTRVIAGQRNAIAASVADPVTQDMLTGQSAQLEKFQWLVRAHSENATGELTW
jgi:starvation-inducible DNA-binding protein